MMLRNLACCIMMAGFLMLLGAGAGHAAASKSIKIDTDGAYAQWSSKDKAGTLIGFEIDLAKVLCKRLALECTFVEHHWDGMIPALHAGKFDVIMAAMSITPERREAVTFTRSYAQVPARFVVAKASPLAGFKSVIRRMDLSTLAARDRVGINGIIKAFRGKTIGVKSASKHEAFLHQFLGVDVEIKTYDKDEDLDLEFQLGQVDAAFGPMSYWKPLLGSEIGDDFTPIGPRIVGGPLGQGVGAAVRRDEKALADILSSAIQGAIDDGSVAILAKRWFGFDASAR